MKKSFLPVILAAFFLLAVNGHADDYWVYPELGEIYVSGRCLCQNDDKEITFAGPGIKDWDIWITKIDSLGKIIFTKKIYDANYQAVPKAILSAGKNSITVGIGDDNESTVAQAIIIKTDSCGNVVKDTCFIPSGHSTAGFQDMVKSNDGMHVAVGGASVPNSSIGDLHLVKFDENLNIKWEKFYSGKGASKIIRDQNSYVTMTSSQGKTYLIKFDQDGNLIWEKKDVRMMESYFIANNINVSSDGYIIIGYLLNGENKKTILIKTDKKGNFIWEKEYRFPELTENLHQGINCWEVNDEYILLVREVKYLGERRLVKTDINGNMISIKNCEQGSVEASNLTLDGKIIILGTIVVEEKMCPSLYKTDCSFDSSIWHEENNQPQLQLSQNYPNPFNHSTCIRYYLPKNGEVSLAIYDLIGHQKDILLNEWQKSGQYSVYWQAKDYPSGVYLYKIISARQTICKKMVLVK